MTEHLERFSLIKDMQHGFEKNKSCLTNLLVFFRRSYGKSSESVQCAITGPCLRMCHRPSA